MATGHTSVARALWTTPVTSECDARVGLGAHARELGAQRSISTNRNHTESTPLSEARVRLYRSCARVRVVVDRGNIGPAATVKICGACSRKRLYMFGCCRQAAHARHPDRVAATAEAIPRSMVCVRTHDQCAQTTAPGLIQKGMLRSVALLGCSSQHQRVKRDAFPLPEHRMRSSAYPYPTLWNHTAWEHGSMRRLHSLGKSLGVDAIPFTKRRVHSEDLDVGAQVVGLRRIDEDRGIFEASAPGRGVVFCGQAGAQAASTSAARRDFHVAAVRGAASPVTAVRGGASPFVHVLFDLRNVIKAAMLRELLQEGVPSLERAALL
eukprot:1591340-Prymnesium_polylepis.2